MAGGKTQIRTRGEGGLYKRKSDGLWVGSVELGVSGDGRRLRKTVSAKTQAEALKKLRALRRTVEDHGFAPSASLTVGAWLQQWVTDIAAAHTKPRTLIGYRSAIEHHLLPTIGGRRMDQLQPAHIREMHRAMRRGIDSPGASGKPLAEATIIKAHRVLSAALSTAVEEGLVVRNVAKIVKAPGKPPSPRQALSAAQARTLLQANLQEPEISRWFAALLTGARQGELLGLQWDRVDLEARTIDLSWQLQRLAHRHGCLRHGDDLPASQRSAVTVPAARQPWPCGYVQAARCPSGRLDIRRGVEHRVLQSSLVLIRPKSAAGTRLVPLAGPMVEVLARHRSNTAGAPNPHNLVWPAPDGRPADHKDDWSAWTAALQRAGLPHFQLHCARHTTATLLMEAGVPNSVAMAVVGHSDVATTRGYQHVDQTLARAALEKVANGLELSAR